MYVLVRDLKNHKGKEVSLRGWVYNYRSSGKIQFLLLRDGHGLCQCVFVKGECEEAALETFSKITQESCVEVKGIVREEKRSPGGYELTGLHLKILSPSDNYPISPKEHGIDFLMNHRHLWLRSKRQHAIMKIRASLIKSMRCFFDERHFTLVDAPIFTPNAAEGTTTLFETRFFDEKTYLSQTGQLYMEAAAAAFGKAYCFGPTFRAEKSKTRRHLLEFWMIEPEMAFVDLYEDMDIAEAFVEDIVQRTLKTCSEELKSLERDTSHLEKVKAPFERIHYKEAVEVLKKENPDFQDGNDFGGGDETIISSQFEKPVFVHHFPTKIKAFYMKEDEKEPEYCLSCDLLATEGYGEIIGGGQREESLSVLKKRIKEHGLKEEHFSWYLDLRKYGSFPHSGFGLGLERTLAWICGLPHVRETTAFPRMYGRHHP